MFFVDRHCVPIVPNRSARFLNRRTLRCLDCHQSISSTWKTTLTSLLTLQPGPVSGNLVGGTTLARSGQRCGGTKTSPSAAANAACLWGRRFLAANIETTAHSAWPPGTSISGVPVTGRAHAAP